MEHIVDSAAADDALAIAARDGDRQAFAIIVERYKSLVCAIAYNALGDIAQSEDCAQETFLAAWQSLGSLREPSRLRSWLSGIARNLSQNAVRRRTRDSKFQDELTPEVIGLSASEPSAQLISHEEQRILWRSLERIPETYREPLILFYREGESVARVSEALALSEDAVKQRLSRGRKLLQDEVLAYVESALKRSSPGKAFTLAVIAALPAACSTTAAATAGAIAAKSAAAKSTGTLSLAGAMLGPLLGIFGAYLGAKSSLAHTQSAPERRFVVKLIWLIGVGAALFSLVLLLLNRNAAGLSRAHPALLAGLFVGAILSYVVILTAFTYWGNKKQQQIRTAQTPRVLQVTNPPGYEYKSPLVFLGLPLVHLKFGNALGLGKGPACGWIAVGDTAVSPLLAVGGLALGTIALGGLAIGGLSLAGAALGIFALGGCSMGFEALGGAALAWHAAYGGLAIAHQYAQGGLSIAEHANDTIALEYFRSHWFSTAGRVLSNRAIMLPILLGPLLIFTRMKKGETKNMPQRRGGTRP